MEINAKQYTRLNSDRINYLLKLSGQFRSYLEDSLLYFDSKYKTFFFK